MSKFTIAGLLLILILFFSIAYYPEYVVDVFVRFYNGLKLIILAAMGNI